MNDFSIEPIINEPFSIATGSNLDFLMKIEAECFEEYRRSSRQMIMRSLKSKQQIVIILKNEKQKQCGAMFLRFYKSQLRITSIAIIKNERGKNYGEKLIQKAIECGELLNMKFLALEIDANNNNLIRWYETFGFEKSKFLEHYYAPNKHAIKMKMILKDPNKYLVVTDFETNFFDGIDNVRYIRDIEYIESEIYQNAKNLRIFNFCTTYKYQSVGYYVSLLALARNQVAYPSASMIRDFNNQKVVRSIGEEVNSLIQANLSFVQEDELLINSYFGFSDRPEFQKLITAMNNLYHSPLIQYKFIKKNEWYLQQIRVLSLNDSSENDNEMLKKFAKYYFTQKRFVRSSLKSYEYDMAILIDRDEKIPPSDKKALEQFEKAAEALGFFVEYITKKDYHRIPEFDALFIRTTTNVNDYTYDFSRYAYAEGLVVIDDPWSILRCANKLYLYEALKKAKVKMPNTWVFNKKGNYKELASKLSYPIILKLPDSAFSKGVYKASDREECLEKLKAMFKRSELIVAQEYMPTKFDWRIGIIDGQFLYACKYYMAKDHWQIVNWNPDKNHNQEGDYEVVGISDVPKNVLWAALKATAAIGDGLYGVDIKVNDNEVYVIEVNDNPSIEYQVEDMFEGSSLYLKIMMSFYSRLENNMKILRAIN